MPTASELLKKYEIRPLKRLGQYFLIDQNILSKIINIAEIKNDETVLEIGAGLGVLTALLAEKAHKVIAVEIDPFMINILREELKDFKNIEIIHQNILNYDFSKALGRAESFSKRLKVIGNIPYNISTQILFRLLENRSIISTMVLMFQKEVADRIISGPGSKNYGILSVLTRMYAHAEREILVSPTCFRPAPNVESAILKIVFRKDPLIKLNCDTEFFFKIVKTAFAQRRKTLLNNLKHSPFASSSPDLENILKDIEIDGMRRGETLSVEEFAVLSNAIYESVSARID
jgi:16S rRNA (adenine1518-N6/adenine1519-N6)-dimethyltransferase